MVELAAIFRRHGPAYRGRFGDRMPPSHLAAMAAIAPCRTEALGGQVSQCPDGGALEDSSHACKHRPGPKCQTEAATRWLAPQRALRLPVPYFLVTCTLPAALRPVARAHQRCLYNLLFQASAAALQALTLASHSLGGPIGLVGVLHTWPRDLAYHPPLHSLVPGGALSPEGAQWRSPRSAAWLVPVRALSQRFRGKCKAALTSAGLCAPVPPQVWKQAWVPHGTPAGTGTEVLTYFAPSIYRMALTNNRLETLEDGHVTFRFKKHSGAGWKRFTLPAAAFLHRFLQHVLPRGFITVRSYGFLSPSRRTVLPQIRARLAAGPRNAPPAEPSPHRARQATLPAPAEARHCRQCGGPLVFLGRLSPTTRAPP